MSVPLSRIPYDSSKFTAFAQVTVINASHGDSNLIDIYQPNSDQSNKWRRVLIDTGPAKEGGKIKAAILKAIDRVAIPKPTNENPVPDPFVPPLAELQITHVDTDHIGNAAAITSELEERIKKWWTTDQSYKCCFAFPHVPDDVPVWYPDSSWKQPRYHEYANNEHWNAVTLRLPMDLLEWARDLSLLGYWVRFKCELTADKTAAEFKWKIIDRKLHPTSTWNSSQWTGIEWNAIDCMYTETFHQQQQTLQLKVTLDVLDVFRPGGTVVIYKRIFGDRDFTVHDHPWNPPPTGFQGPYIRPTVPTPEAKELAKHNTQFMQRIESHRPLRALGSAIRDLIDAKVPGIQTLNPLQDKDQSYPVGMGTGCVQFYVSPNVDVYRDLARFLVAKDLYSGDHIHHLDTDLTVTNRASVVTVFHRSDLDLKMIFTGDAYDQHCDIRRTVFKYDNKIEHSIRTDVLKIPHHGSEVTVRSAFYELVRADVYLVCASHDHVSENPRVSTLISIAKGFFTGPKRAANLPFRIYFSFPKILEVVNGHQSAAAALIESRWGPVQNSAGVWNYEMYRPKGDEFGRVLFGRETTKGGLIDVRHEDDWVICHTWNGAKAVVKKY